MRHCAYFVLVALFVCCTISAAFAQNVSLIGSLRDGSGPVVGASVYVTCQADANGAPVNGTEVGPVASDRDGDFAFYDLPPGAYAMRIAVAGTNVWEGHVHVPSKLDPIVLH